MDSMGSMDEPTTARDFKKNRNMSTNSHSGPPLSINLPPNNSVGYSSPPSNHILNSPTIQNMPPLQSPMNPNMLQPTNNKINGQYTEPQTPKSPTYSRVSEDHRLII